MMAAKSSSLVKRKAESATAAAKPTTPKVSQTENDKAKAKARDHHQQQRPNPKTSCPKHNLLAPLAQTNEIPLLFSLQDHQYDRHYATRRRGP